MGASFLLHRFFSSTVHPWAEISTPLLVEVWIKRSLLESNIDMASAEPARRNRNQILPCMQIYRGKQISTIYFPPFRGAEMQFSSKPIAHWETCVRKCCTKPFREHLIPLAACPPVITYARPSSSLWKIPIQNSQICTPISRTKVFNSILIEACDDVHHPHARNQIHSLRGVICTTKAEPSYRNCGNPAIYISATG